MNNLCCFAALAKAEGLKDKLKVLMVPQGTGDNKFTFRSESNTGCEGHGYGPFRKKRKN